MNRGGGGNSKPCLTAKNDRGKEKINEQKSEREGVRERRGVPAIFCSKNGGGGDELVTMRVLCCVVLCCVGQFKALSL